MILLGKCIRLFSQTRLEFRFFSEPHQLFLCYGSQEHHKKFAQSRMMSFFLTYVPAALATTDIKNVISMLQIPVPDEIHMEDRNHGLA